MLLGLDHSINENHIAMLEIFSITVHVYCIKLLFMYTVTYTIAL